MAKESASVFYLFCILRVSNCSLRLPRMLVLNSSSILPIFSLLIDPVADLFTLTREQSLRHFLVLDFPLER